MTGINCNGQQLSFTSQLKVYPGTRTISPSTAESCIGQRQLFVRFDVDRQQYVFREAGGQCGNFAIVEVQNVLKSTIRSVGSGHSAIARVSADGQSLTTLKIYTLSPSAEDSWRRSLPQMGTGGRVYCCTDFSPKITSPPSGWSIRRVRIGSARWTGYRCDSHWPSWSSAGLSRLLGVRIRVSRTPEHDYAEEYRHLL